MLRNDDQSEQKFSLGQVEYTFSGIGYIRPNQADFQDLIARAKAALGRGDIEQAQSLRKQAADMLGLKEALDDVDNLDTLYCKQCHVVIGTYRPGTLYLATTYHTDRYVAYCKQCGAKVRWYPVQEPDETYHEGLQPCFKCGALTTRQARLGDTGKIDPLLPFRPICDSCGPSYRVEKNLSQ